MAASVVTPFIGLIALSMIPNSPATKWTKWGLYLITVPYVLALFLAWTLIPSNIAGRTKKTIVSSCTFLGYCVGNMAGSQIFKDADKPRYGKHTTQRLFERFMTTCADCRMFFFSSLQSLELLELLCRLAFSSF